MFAWVCEGHACTAALLCLVCRTPVNSVCDREDRQEEDHGLVLPHILFVCPAPLRLHREVSALGRLLALSRLVGETLKSSIILLLSFSLCVSLSFSLSFYHFLFVFISIFLFFFLPPSRIALTIFIFIARSFISGAFQVVYLYTPALS